MCREIMLHKYDQFFFFFLRSEQLSQFDIGKRRMKVAMSRNMICSTSNFISSGVVGLANVSSGGLISGIQSIPFQAPQIVLHSSYVYNFARAEALLVANHRTRRGAN